MSILRDRTTGKGGENVNGLVPEGVGNILQEQSEFHFIGETGNTWHITQNWNHTALCGAKVRKKGEKWRRQLLIKERVCWLCQNRIEPAMIDQFRRRAGLK